MFLSPLLEETAVAQGDVLGAVNTETTGRPVDPFRGAFKFGEIADGGFVDDAMALSVFPFAAPLFIAKGRNKSKGTENLRQGLAVRNVGLGFDAVLVGILAGPLVGKAFMGQHPSAGVAAQAQNLSPGAHSAVGGVVECVALKAPRCLLAESGRLKLSGKGDGVFEAKFDFGFDCHDQE